MKILCGRKKHHSGKHFVCYPTHSQTTTTFSFAFSLFERKCCGSIVSFHAFVWIWMYTHIYIYIHTSFMSQHKSCANCGCQMVKGQLPNRWPSPEYNFTYSVDQKGMKRVPLPTWPNHFVSRYFLFNLLTRATPEFLTEFWMLLENKIRFRVSVFQFSIQKQHALGFSTSSVLKEYQHR